MATTISLAIKNNDDFVFSPWEYQKQFPIPSVKFSLNIQIKSKYEEPFFHYKEIPFSKNLDLHGYFQSYKYFDSYRNDIIKLLTPNDLPSKKMGVTSIHVRRTDYLVHKGCYTILDKKYYSEAMKNFNSFLVFSDDIEFCKKEFIGPQFKFQHSDPVTDLASMISCENHIIANSSFSWWAAYLSQDSNVIAPASWFGPKIQHNTKDLLPPTWKKI
jgi:hypothetical protein